MNFDHAIKVHLEWKTKFTDFIKGRVNISLDQIGNDSVCDLAKWMKEDGKKYTLLPDYKKMLESHKEFHAAAAEIAKKKMQGVFVAKNLIDENSVFDQSSKKILDHIQNLKKHSF